MQLTTRCSNDQGPLGTAAFLSVARNPISVFFGCFQSLAFHTTMHSSCTLMQERCYLCCFL